MKKSIVVVLCVIFAFVMLACGKSDLAANPRLSELRNDILTGECEAYGIIAVTGMRETPFNIDGFSQKEKTSFTILTLTPNEYVSGANYSYKAIIGGKEYSGQMVRHPFNQTYSAEIEAETAENALEIMVNDGAERTVRVESVKNGSFISGQKAFEIAQKKLKKSIDGKGGKQYEIFVRLIENPINSAGGYFWYVAYVFEDNTTLAVLIEPVTMEIAAIKD